MSAGGGRTQATKVWGSSPPIVFGLVEILNDEIHESRGPGKFEGAAADHLEVAVDTAEHPA